MNFQMNELFEIMMLVSFGASWPLNALKSYRARTTKGKSLPFVILIFTGYIWGIISKLVNPNGYHWYVMFVYVFNIFFVGLDLCLYFRNLRLDRQGETQSKN